MIHISKNYYFMKNIVSQIFFTNNLNSKNNEFNLINL